MAEPKTLVRRSCPDKGKRQPEPWPSKEGGWILVERSRDCILLVDRSTKGILRSNPATSELLGHTPKSLFELEDHPAESVENWVSQVKTRGVHAERRYRRRDGSALLMDMRAEMLDEETMLVISRDSSDRRVAEHKRRSSEQMATISFIISGLAHDMRNCLTAIDGNASMIIREAGRAFLMDGRFPADMISCAQDILKAGEKIGMMGKRLENLASGIKEEPGPLSVKRLLRNCSHFITKPNLSVSLEIPEHIRPVLVVPSYASRAIENLFTNTIQAMDGLKLGSAKITIKAENTDIAPGNPLSLIPGEYVMISFTDDAGGIAAELLPTIFECGCSTKGKGRGMGLAISRFNIRECGGEMDVESFEGVGTTFRIYLPASDEMPANKKPITGDFKPPL